ncbi:uroporphyrin-III C-methyltransferase [Kurthia zopfii]|uniref:Uroporphyrinogen-III C-methyltransferase n=1 Tax=Kurthia zopfii TaxID=1650 RepID=A0A2U3AAY5_9BACL|nr:uroporphyrinogen-III C-methyltransferase [Kurthia zopfii]PWI21692.1 uroporphyrinogen-III C-methyltransferase [Kurthia zopfii]TDR35745.1 uroporphyrin-III C-methyltransferase [Kurthia zopfii]STX09926.1 Siroheme synthase [Kurthia zopfii]VEI07418.1 Siroheme synthase [Kurthia zopfii]GEK31214.1 uroporphyrin-III C-methyltransferase [Kurthia zopfii]
MEKVIIAGAGPGDLELITVKALKAIQNADVILYDRLINEELLREASENAILIYCGKKPKQHALIQQEINEQLVKYALKGLKVLRLKGGDPFVFGRGAEEAEVLADAGIPFEIVPGITSGIAAAAYAGIPVTHRELSSSFAIVTGHMKNEEEDAIKWKNLAQGVDTLAIYMGVQNLPYIVSQLLLYGKNEETPVALVNWGTYGKQRTVTGTLSTIIQVVQAEKIENPSMIIVGKVVKMHEKISWFKELALV